jgi:hypothetical protein
LWIGSPGVRNVAEVAPDVANARKYHLDKAALLTRNTDRTEAVNYERGIKK